MSSKPDRGNVFRLDKSGNIDAELLSKELTDALAFDIGYRQKDNMKKRAVKTAPDYEAFRNMVACAGLKKVSRQEVESLGDSKKGWKKVGDDKKGNVGASILGSEALEQTKRKKAEATLLGGRLRAPKNSSEFNRDWRRVKSVDDKIRYLALVGDINAARLLTAGGDTELLEEVLAFLFGGTLDPSRFVEDGCVLKVLSEMDQGTTEVTGGEEIVDEAALYILSWLYTLSNMEKFDFARQFMDAKLLSDISVWLQTLLEGKTSIEEIGIGPADVGKVDIPELLLRFVSK